MHSADVRLLQPPAFDLRFPSFCAAGRTLDFVLDAGGATQFDALSERALDYLFALILLGRDYGCPTVLASHWRG